MFLSFFQCVYISKRSVYFCKPCLQPVSFLNLLAVKNNMYIDVYVILVNTVKMKKDNVLNYPLSAKRSL